MNYFKYNTLIMVLIPLGLMLTASCSSGTSSAPLFQSDGAAREDRWTAELKIDGKSTPLTLIVLSREKYDGRARLLILSSFGAVLGDCRLEGVKSSCLNSAPGAGPLLDKVSLAFLDMLGSDSAWLLTSANKGEPAGDHWLARKENGELIIYSRLGLPSWELKLQRLAGQ